MALNGYLHNVQSTPVFESRAALVNSRFKFIKMDNLVLGPAGLSLWIKSGFGSEGSSY